MVKDALKQSGVVCVHSTPALRRLNFSRSGDTEIRQDNVPGDRHIRLRSGRTCFGD